MLRYVSGIQPWNGNAGILIRNASANATNSSFCELSPTRFSRRNAYEKSGVAPLWLSTATATAPASISSDPTSV